MTLDAEDHFCKGVLHVRLTLARNMSSFTGVGRLNHVAIAVQKLEEASAIFSQVLKATVSPVQELPEHGVKVQFVQLPNINLELLEPLGQASPIQQYLEKHPRGGLHHLCFEVPNIDASIDHITSLGHVRLLNREPKIGSHGTPVTFLHPADVAGCLVELQET